MSSSNVEKNAQIIKQKAKKFGFQSCGISKAEFLEEDALPLEKWLKNNYHGEVQYMENYFDKRISASCRKRFNTGKSSTKYSGIDSKIRF